MSLISHIETILIPCSFQVSVFEKSQTESASNVKFIQVTTCLSETKLGSTSNRIDKSPGVDFQTNCANKLRPNKRNCRNRNLFVCSRLCRLRMQVVETSKPEPRQTPGTHTHTSTANPHPCRQTTEASPSSKRLLPTAWRAVLCALFLPLVGQEVDPQSPVRHIGNLLDRSGIASPQFPILGSFPRFLDWSGAA